MEMLCAFICFKGNDHFPVPLEVNVAPLIIPGKGRMHLSDIIISMDRL